MAKRGQTKSPIHQLIESLEDTMSRPDFYCPQCNRTISCDFGYTEHCPHCGYKYGSLMKFCKDCRFLFFPVYKYCSHCGKELERIEDARLNCIDLGLESVGGNYEYVNRFGLSFDELGDVTLIDGILEENFVKNYPQNDMPLLIGTLKTKAGEKALEQRMRSLNGA